MENLFKYCINSKEKYIFFSGEELHSTLSVLDTISFDTLKNAHIEYMRKNFKNPIDWVIDSMKQTRSRLRLYDNPMFIIISRDIRRDSVEYKLARVN